jgi:hypothetical protein
MAYLRLEPHVTFALVGGRPIFLDLRRDRYFALDPETEAAFERARRGEELSHGDAATTRLLATHLFTLADVPSPLAPAADAITSGPSPRPAIPRASSGPFAIAEAWLLVGRGGGGRGRAPPPPPPPRG